MKVLTSSEGSIDEFIPEWTVKRRGLVGGSRLVGLCL
jgi:hypothetical protein